LVAEISFDTIINFLGSCEGAFKVRDDFHVGHVVEDKVKGINPPVNRNSGYFLKQTSAVDAHYSVIDSIFEGSQFKLLLWAKKVRCVLAGINLQRFGPFVLHES
jgi:hypothetical protein